MANPKYYDKRQDFWKQEFEKALDYEAYLSAGEESHRNKWRNMEADIELTESRKKLIGKFTRKINVLVYTGIWCGDCVRQGPIFKKIGAANPNINIRYVERIDGTPLGDELRMNGASKVPVVVFLSEDFFELGRFGDRLLTIYRRMERTQLGSACSTGLVAPPDDERMAEIQEWVDIFERMHIMLRLSPMLRERYDD
ncbi:MAG: thioredoxin family protein [Candidatus Sumerlaeia bacterium]